MFPFERKLILILLLNLYWEAVTRCNETTKQQTNQEHTIVLRNRYLSHHLHRPSPPGNQTIHASLQRSFNNNSCPITSSLPFPSIIL